MKKYTHRDTIIRDIDAALAKIQKARTVAQGFLDEEELLTGTGMLSELRAAREAADKQFRKIKRLQEVSLPKLKEKLAAMDTIPLPGIEQAQEQDESPSRILCEWAWAKVNLENLQAENKSLPTPEFSSKIAEAIHAFGKANRKKKKLDSTNRHTDQITLGELGLTENGEAITPSQTAPESPSCTASTPPVPPSA